MKETQTSRKTVYQCGFLTVHEDGVTLASGEQGKRIVIDHVGGAAMVPLTKQNDVILIKQYRYAVGDYVIEIPAGKKEDYDDDGLTCALRECEEETGYTGEDITKIGQIYTSVGYCNEIIEIFALYDAVTIPGWVMDPNEPAEVIKMPLREAVQMVRTGKIRDAKTIVALLSL